MDVACRMMTDIPIDCMRACGPDRSFWVRVMYKMTAARRRRDVGSIGLPRFFITLSQDSVGLRSIIPQPESWFTTASMGLRQLPFLATSILHI